MRTYITHSPNIMSGAPVIKGTRIPISRIIFLLGEGHTLDSIHQMYPYVSSSTLSGVISELMKLIDSGAYGASSSEV